MSFTDKSFGGLVNNSSAGGKGQGSSSTSNNIIMGRLKDR